MDSQAKASSNSTPGTHAAGRAAKVCVYTSLMGGYESLNEQPMARQSNIPFICFTDDPELSSETWQIRLVDPLFALDPARSQRDFKLRPHVHLADFDRSMYIDNSVILGRPPEDIFDRYVAPVGFSLAQHSFRDSVLDEFLVVAKDGLDEPSRVFEQLNHYTLTTPEILEERPFWGGILIRDHHAAAVQAMLDIWWANVLRYSRRDQLSLNAAFRQSGLAPEIMDIENFSSWFHSWPHAPGRDRNKGALTPSVSFSPPVARVRQLESELAQAQEEHQGLLQTEAWHLGTWLMGTAKRHPVLAGPTVRLLRRLSRRTASR